MKKNAFKLVATAFMAAFIVFTTSFTSSAQSSEIYESGSVWNVTYIRTHANMDEEYLKGLAQTWKAAMEEYVNMGLLMSYKVLLGQAFGEGDFNIMLMMEFKNYSAFDPDPSREARFDAIEKKIKESMGENYDKTIKNYTNIRDILGTKSMREIKLK